MARLICTRVLIAALILFLVSVIVFAATEILPGSVVDAVLGQSATPEAVAALREKMNLDAPAVTRYFLWLGKLLSGDPGVSLVNGQPVATLIASRLSNSLELAALATLFCLPIGVGLGVLTAIARGTFIDRSVNLVTLAVVSVPEFFIATLAVLIFAVHLKILPAVAIAPNTSSLTALFRSFTLPVLSLSGVIIAQMLRMIRAALIDEMAKPYIEMAHLKGVSHIRLVLFHALPNALGPIANAVALSLSHLLGGAIIIEAVFNYPGLARLLVDSVSTRDLPLLQACTMIFSLAYLLLVTVADVISLISNPRLRIQ